MKKIIMIIILILVVVSMGYFTFIIGPYNYTKNVATVGSVAIQPICWQIQSDNKIHYCDGGVKMSPSHASAGWTKVGCKTSGACNYDQDAGVRGKCAFANFAQVAPPARTATSTRPTPYWIVSYRIENADNSILTSGSYRYFPPPNFTPTLGANACSVRIGGQSFGDWLQSLIPEGQ